MSEEFEKDLQEIKDDDVGQLTSNQMKEKLESDVNTLTDYIEQVKKERKNYKEQADIDIAIWDMMQKPGMLRKIEPVYEFEKSEEYWKLQEKKQFYKIRESRATIEGQLEQYEHQLKELTRKLEEAKNKLDKFLNSGDEE